MLSLLAALMIVLPPTPSGQQAPPSQDVPAMSARSPDPVSGPGASAFDQFDLGAAPVVNGSVPAWTPLAQTGVEVTPATIEVKAGDTVDSLLLAEGVRPDNYSRGLVAAINPNLGVDLKLREGQQITLFTIAGTETVTNGPGLLALQPYQSQRAEIRDALAALQAGAASTEGMQPGEQRAIDRAVDRLVTQERAAILTDSASLARAAALLDQARATLTADAPVGQDLIVHTTNQATRFYSARAADPGRSSAQRPTVRVELLPPAFATSGGCLVKWAIVGFSTSPGSVQTVVYNGKTTFPVEASDIVVWVTKGDQTVSPREVVSKGRLLREPVAEVPITVTLDCGA